MSIEHYWSDTDRRKTYLTVTLPSTNPTWTGLGSNPSSTVTARRPNQMRRMARGVKLYGVKYPMGWNCMVSSTLWVEIVWCQVPYGL